MELTPGAIRCGSVKGVEHDDGQSATVENPCGTIPRRPRNDGAGVAPRASGIPLGATRLKGAQ